ncbi:DUF4363 family protein [Clostridium felsineum]|uniref:DUF4363 family protein n=1 Tax=Clostridium felsineum TaxID=36839 RepID=UPI00214D1845|nr:DUF4363 family protein [Clostridium felsineum]MCR3758827.1 DUF4363 family protein [Clostridium felsineum]
MKNIIIALSIFAAVVLMSFFSIQYLNKTCNKLLSVSNKIQNSLEKGSYSKADYYEKEFEKEWYKESSILSAFIHHMETDDISLEVERLSQSIKYKEKKDAMESAHSLTFLIKHLSLLEKINIENIL